MSIRVTAATVAGLLAVSMMAAPFPSWAQEGPFTTLAPALDEPGDDGVWSWGLVKNGFTMRNLGSSDTAYSYFWAVGDAPAYGSRSMSTDFEVTAGNELSSAGFIYNFDTDTGDYMMFVIGMDGYATIYRHDDTGGTEVAFAQTDLAHPGINEVSIVETGRQAAFYVNGELALSYKGTEPPHGGIGIVAWGIGTYTFRGFIETPRD